MIIAVVGIGEHRIGIDIARFPIDGAATPDKGRCLPTRYVAVTDGECSFLLRLNLAPRSFVSPENAIIRLKGIDENPINMV